MYILLAVVMLMRGFTDAIMMRSQQAMAPPAARPAFCRREHYDQIFSAHGTIMIFFMAMPFMVGLMNFVRAAADRHPRRRVPGDQLASSFWLTATGVLLINVSLVVGEFARTGWLVYPPLSELAF